MEELAQETIGKGKSVVPRILVADDQLDVLEALRLLLKQHGYHTETVTSPAAILEALAAQSFDLLLMDLNYARDTTSGREGLDLLGRLKALDGALPVVVMTGWGTVGLAVETMQRGVEDFVQKPWENERLLEILKTQVERGRARREAERLEAEEKLHRSAMAQQFHKREQEIEEARKIQQGFLPKEIPQIRGFQISGAWQPARIVGGDYFDVLKLRENTLALCIADVAGKGLPAALLMSNLQATVRGLASAAMPPRELCSRVNRFIHQNIAEDRFITLFYGVLDAGARRLCYANAGHNAPVVVHSIGFHDRLRNGGGVLGVFPEQGYEQGEIALTPGDRILLFTDGVTEARNPGGEEFGEPHLLRLLVEHRALSAVELQKKILGALADFSRGDLEDDATLIVVAVE
jgi:sigma-B regulation protein RsbU (phosphoserine phosphatase)